MVLYDYIDRVELYRDEENRLKIYRPSVTKKEIRFMYSTN